MPDDPENLVLVFLRRIDAKVDRLGEDVQDLKHRMTTLEQQVGALAATEASHYAGLASRLDRVEARLDRIERRLDLVDAPA
jgi:outer membrane murein-binding lipoprotein Lpp